MPDHLQSGSESRPRDPGGVRGSRGPRWIVEPELAAMLDAAAVGIVQLNARGRIVHLNAEAERLLGVRREHVVGRRIGPWSGRIVDIHGDPWTADLPAERTRRTGAAQHDVMLGVQVSGDAATDAIRWMTVCTRPLSPRSGHACGPVGVLVTLIPTERQEDAGGRDIADQAANERVVADLRDHSERLAAAVQLCADPILITDRTGTVEFANASAIELEASLGRRLRIGERAIPFRSGVVDESVIEVILGTCLGGSSWTGEIAVRSAEDGRVASPAAMRWLSVKATPRMDASGHVEAIVVVQREITDHMNQRAADQLAAEGSDARVRISDVLGEHRPLQDRLERAMSVVAQLPRLEILGAGGIFIVEPGADHMRLLVHGDAMGEGALAAEARVRAWELDRAGGPAGTGVVVSGGALDAVGSGQRGHYLVPLRCDGHTTGVMLLHTDGHPAAESVRLRELERIGEVIGQAIARERHDEQLRRLAWRMRKATEAAGVGVWDFDLHSGELFWDDTMYALFGVPRDSGPDVSTHDQWRSRVVPEDLAGAEACLWRAVDRGEDFNTTYRISLPDGAIRHIKAVAAIERDEAGVPVRVVGINADVTEEREITLALREAQAVGRLGDWSFDPVTRAMQWSDQLCRMVGREVGAGAPTLDDAIGTFLAAGGAELGRSISASTATGEPFTLVLEVASPPTDVRFVRVEGRARFGSGRDVVALYGTMMDVTAQVERERTLGEVTTAMDAAHDCVFMFEPETLRFVYVNRGATDQIGYSAAELAEMTPIDIKPAFDEAAFRAVVQPLIDRPGTVDTFRTEHQHRDGTLIPVEIVLQLVPGVGTSGRFVAVVRDISGQLGIERELKSARDAAETASRSKSEFLANMSHEIRTPMTAILGFADLLGDEEDVRQDPVEAARAINTIRTNARHLLALINDILDVSKIEAGRMSAERMATRPTQIVGDVVNLMRGRAEGKGIRLDVAWETPVPAEIQSDPTRLRQILVNLVGNAIKFTEQGSVTIAVGFEAGAAGGRGGGGGGGDGVGGSDGGEGDGRDRLRFAVRDTGIGMTPEQCEHIARFEAFSQADGSMTRRFGGTGLGLRISNSLSELLGGGLTVEAELNAGSTFTSRIATGELGAVAAVGTGAMLSPEAAAADVAEVAGGVGAGCRERAGVGVGISACEADAAGPAGDAASGDVSVEMAAGAAFAAGVTRGPAEPVVLGAGDVAGPLAGLRILLAEDGPDNQRLISFHLRKAGADVAVADNGRRALDHLAEACEGRAPFDLVLMDMQMPVLDGYAAARELRADGETVPVIALTAHAMDGDREKCLQAGCDDYLTKPIDKATLVERCRQWGRGERVRGRRAA